MSRTGVLTPSEANIRAVRYSPRGDRDTELLSRATVQSAQMHELGRPRPGGVSDANMGTTESTYTCATCHERRGRCAGHPGSYAFNYPMISPIMMPEVAKWLRIVCFNCGHIIYSDEDMRRNCGTANISLDIVAKTSNTVHQCATCGAPHPIVRRPDKNAYYYTLTGIASGDGSASGEVILRAQDIARIFDRLHPDEVARVGKNPISHPRKFIWSNLLVPSPVMRPDEKRSGGRGSGSHAMTVHLRSIIEFQQTSIPPSIPDRIDPKFAGAIDEAQHRLATMLTIKDEREHSVADMFRGKTGLLRGLILGKRVLGMARSTIDGSSGLHLDEISIPLFFAQTLQIMEHVQSFNRARLMEFVRNGPDTYPGCSRIIKRNGAEYRPGMREIVLEDGDIICRDLINGDIVAFNRQPTLTISNITAMRIVVDHNALANGMNVLVCPFFNADFDGDQMNVMNYQCLSSLNEQEMMASVIQRMVSYTTGANMLAQSNDSRLGLMKITQSGVYFNKYHACAMYGNTILVPDIEGAIAEHSIDVNGRKVLCGRDVVALSFAHAPISFRGRSRYYDSGSAWASIIARDPSCENVVIRDGYIVSGCLDASLGAGHGGIYQEAVREYGPASTLDLIYDHQQIGINYLSIVSGFTTGIRDFLLSAGAKERINDLIRTTLTRANELAERLHRGTIIPPVDQTVMQAYELMQIAVQRPNDSFALEVFRDITNPRAHGIFEMMAAGKGTPTFLVNMMATVGLILISGARAALTFGHGRTLPYFQRFDESPSGRGFSPESFIEGLSVIGTIYNAMMSRTDVISRALFTSITGDNNRKSEKSLESVITNNYRMAVKGQAIVSLIYGGDFYDPRYLENVQYAPGMMGDSAFEEGWRYVGAESSSVFEQEWAQLSADRKMYRDIRIHSERMTLRDRMNGTIRSPINIGRLLHAFARTLRKYRKDKDGQTEPETKFDVREISDADLAIAAQHVAQFCDELPYLFINDIQRARHGWIPKYIEAACTYLRIYVRSELASARIRKFCADESLKCNVVVLVDETIKAISVLVMIALIDSGCAVGILAAQSFCEPFTQDMLDSYKTSALTGGNAGKVKMDKCREVMSAYSVHKLRAPAMTIILRDEWAQSEERAREIVHRVEMLKLAQIIDLSRAYIFVEQFGEPIHPDFVADREIFAPFAEDNPLYRAPSDLLSWCLRFVFDREMLVQKAISVDEVCATLREKYEELYFVHTNELADESILRVYIRSGAKLNVARGSEYDCARTSGARSGSIQARVEDIMAVLLDTIVRGVRGISMATVEKVLRTRIDDKGAVVNAPDTYCVRTTGTNMAQVSRIEGIDAQWLRTDAIMEIAEYLGIEAARALIIVEMRKLVEKCDLRHYMIYADEMTRTGRVTSIESGGLTSREISNVALRAGQASPVRVFTEAAVNARRDVVGGISGPLTYGQIPRIGTLYNNFAIDPAIIAKYKRGSTDIVSDL